MRKILKLIIALTTVLTVFTIVGSIVFVYPIVAGQQLTLQSGQPVQYKQGWRQYSLKWVSPHDPEYSVQGSLLVYADNFTPANYDSGWELSGGIEGLGIAQGETYNLSGFGLKITIISGVQSNNLVISVHPLSASFWQTTTITYLTVVAILSAAIVAQTLYYKRHNDQRVLTCFTS